MKIGVHQWSALSPLLFIMVMDALMEDVRDGSLMEFLYADDFILCWKSLNEVMEMEKCSGRKGSEGECYYLGRKVVF